MICNKIFAHFLRKNYSRINFNIIYIPNGIMYKCRGKANRVHGIGLLYPMRHKSCAICGCKCRSVRERYPQKFCGATEIVTYANDNLHHIVFALADPEINGGYTSDQELLEIMESLQETLQHIDIETQLLPGC